jgi:hypothetical protein
VDKRRRFIWIALEVIGAIGMFAFAAFVKEKDQGTAVLVIAALLIVSVLILGLKRTE